MAKQAGFFEAMKIGANVDHMGDQDSTTQIWRAMPD